VTENDRLGQPVSLGGSTTSSLSDNAFYFGLNGNDNIFKRVYTVYGDIDHSYYPSDLPVILPYDTVVNTAYLQALLAKVAVLAPVAKPVFSATAPIVSVVAKRAWNIEFETGKASFTGDAVNTLEDLLNQVSVSNLTVQITGHTDNVGNSQSNLELSKKRSEAVKAWLVANAASNFPVERIRARGFGDSQPVAANTTPEGRAKNRRVEVLLLATE